MKMSTLFLPSTGFASRPFTARSGTGRAGVHHLGYWSDEVRSRPCDASANGLTWRSVVITPMDPGAALGVRQGQPVRASKRVSRAMEPFIAYWWSTAAAQRK